MRSIVIKAACIAAIVGSPWIACSQHYYVVVGAFAADENASEFKGYVPVQATDSMYTVSERENLLHFYLLKTTDRETAISKTLQLRKAIESLGGNDLAETTNQESSSASASSSSVTANAGLVPPKPVGKYFKFKIESPEGELVPGKVHHVDFEEGRDLGSYNTNTFVDLLRPGYSNEPMAVVCGMFGYKEIYKYIDYANPSSTDQQAYVDAQGVWVIPYRLERVEAGDVSPMYNVSFYKDAAIMRESSQMDLDELVRMMQKNPYYEITIHAHCNGKNKREIIAVGPNKNYFDVAGSVQLTGSARDLTALRAEAIRSYLADHGIDPKRTKIFSWGGRDMLVKADSPNANLNDRIEIEFTRD
jgi:outer membrane protein OmpA-like peptidoglycan-associated protein